jgi:type I restriction-modification system DNA methylase subunit
MTSVRRGMTEDGGTKSRTRLLCLGLTERCPSKMPWLIEMNTIELNQLCNHLWESANILRGPVDAADFKTYIFPLLFFKRISDVCDEEIADALDESGGVQQYFRFPENHHFQIPDDCHWADVCKKTSNVGQGLQRAMRETEKAKHRFAIFYRNVESTQLTTINCGSHDV